MKQTANIIKFAQFEEEIFLSETRDDVESGDESDYNSIMPPLFSKEEMDSMDSGDESDGDLIYTEMLEDIRGGSHSHPKKSKRSTL